MFFKLLVALVEPGGPIKVTETMKTLYREVREGSKSIVRLKGPPGVGKTTSLYWLYQQLKHDSSVSVMVVPFNASCEAEEDDVIARLCDVSKLVVLMDVVSPSEPQAFKNFTKSVCS